MKSKLNKSKVSKYQGLINSQIPPNANSFFTPPGYMEDFSTQTARGAFPLPVDSRPKPAAPLFPKVDNFSYGNANMDTTSIPGNNMTKAMGNIANVASASGLSSEVGTIAGKLGLSGLGTLGAAMANPIGLGLSAYKMVYDIADKNNQLDPTQFIQQKNNIQQAQYGGDLDSPDFIPNMMNELMLPNREVMNRAEDTNKGIFASLAPIDNTEQYSNYHNQVKYANDINRLNEVNAVRPSAPSRITLSGKTRAVRNNNPGNIKDAGDLGRDDKGHGVFSTPELGFQALVNKLTAAQLGKSKVYKPDMTIEEVAKVYAPKSDGNDPVAYAKFIAKQVGKDTNARIADLDTNRWATAISKMEDRNMYNQLKSRGIVKYQKGGMVNSTGYTPGTSTFNNPYNIIPSNEITMKSTPFPVMGIDNLGTKQLMMPGKDYKFPGSHVLEIPQYQKGGKIKSKEYVPNIQTITGTGIQFDSNHLQPDETNTSYTGKTVNGEKIKVIRKPDGTYVNATDGTKVVTIKQKYDKYQDDIFHNAILGWIPGQKVDAKFELPSKNTALLLDPRGRGMSSKRGTQENLDANLTAGRQLNPLEHIDMYNSKSQGPVTIYPLTYKDSQREGLKQYSMLDQTTVNTDLFESTNIPNVFKFGDKHYYRNSNGTYNLVDKEYKKLPDGRLFNHSIQDTIPGLYNFPPVRNDVLEKKMSKVNGYTDTKGKIFVPNEKGNYDLQIEGRKYGGKISSYK